jgi:hypothetical protein
MLIMTTSSSDENVDQSATSAKRQRETDMDICSKDEVFFALPASKRTPSVSTPTNLSDCFSKPLKVLHHNNVPGGLTNPAATAKLLKKTADEKFFTPQVSKLVKPCQFAFHTTGFISKKNRPKRSTQPTPDTPSKITSPMYYFPHSSSTKKPLYLNRGHDTPRFTPSAAPTPTKFSPFFETPVKSSSRTHSTHGTFTNQTSPTSFRFSNMLRSSKKDTSVPGKIDFGSPPKHQQDASPFWEAGLNDSENSLDNYLKQSLVKSPGASSASSTPSTTSPVKHKTTATMLLPDDPMSCEEEYEEDEPMVSRLPFQSSSPREEPQPYYHFHTPFPNFLTREYFEQQQKSGYSTFILLVPCHVHLLISFHRPRYCQHRRPVW